MAPKGVKKVNIIVTIKQHETKSVQSSSANKMMNNYSSTHCRRTPILQNPMEGNNFFLLLSTTEQRDLTSLRVREVTCSSTRHPPRPGLPRGGSEQFRTYASASSVLYIKYKHQELQLQHKSYTNSFD